MLLWKRHSMALQRVGVFEPREDGIFDVSPPSQSWSLSLCLSSKITWVSPLRPLLLLLLFLLLLLRFSSPLGPFSLLKTAVTAPHLFTLNPEP